LAPYGLMGLAGTAPDVSVAGYLLGGGLSWFARSHGLASNHVVAIELVTADGELRRVDAEHEPELFWAVRGGGGNFGVVTAIELRAFELTEVVAGMMFWPIESGREALRGWSEWTATLPEEVTSIARRMTFPPVPQVPEHLRGRTFIVMDAVSQLSEDETAELLAPLRELKPEVDTFGPMPVPALLHLHMDPDEPVPGHGDGLMVGELSEATIDAVLDAGPELLIVEVRHLGGACGRADGVPGAVAAFEAEYLVFAGGIAMDEATTTATQRAMDRLLAALAPWQRGATYINFRTAVTPGEQLWGAERYRELQVLKALYDPANVMHSNHAVEPSVSPQVV
jgi:FAD/FMN-containing dehydrogenase